MTVLRADTQFSKASALKLPAPDTYDVAIAAVYVRVADRKGSVGLPDEQAALEKSAKSVQELIDVIKTKMASQ